MTSSYSIEQRFDSVIYCIFTNRSTSHLVAPKRIIRLLMKRKFYAYLLWLFCLQLRYLVVMDKMEEKVITNYWWLQFIPSVEYFGLTDYNRSYLMKFYEMYTCDISLPYICKNLATLRPQAKSDSSPSPPSPLHCPLLSSELITKPSCIKSLIFFMIREGIRNGSLLCSYPVVDSSWGCCLHTKANANTLVHNHVFLFMKFGGYKKWIQKAKLVLQGMGVSVA